MRHGAAIIALVSALWASGSACAMNSKSGASDCIVSGGDKLPAETGPEAICDAVRGAILNSSAGPGFKVEVVVTSASSLTARILVGGKTLPDEHMAVSDRGLTKGSIDRFAKRIAEVVAKAS
jgi:hypothetical protein